MGGCSARTTSLNVGLGREDNRNIADHARAFCDWLAARGRIPSDMPSKFKGHAYILHGRSRRISSGDGIVLAGDAIGLAYDRSGEGIRPAVESAVNRGGVHRGCRRIDRREHLCRLRAAPPRTIRRARDRDRTAGVDPGRPAPDRCHEAARHGLVLAPPRPRRLVPPPPPAPAPCQLTRRVPGTAVKTGSHVRTSRRFCTQ